MLAGLIRFIDDEEWRQSLEQRLLRLLLFNNSHIDSPPQWPNNWWLPGMLCKQRSHRLRSLLIFILKNGYKLWPETEFEFKHVDSWSAIDDALNHFNVHDLLIESLQVSLAWSHHIHPPVLSRSLSLNSLEFDDPRQTRKQIFLNFNWSLLKTVFFSGRGQNLEFSKI